MAVAKGQDVSVGDTLGRVGHTGNSTAPHLHFQLMDATMLDARGIPCAFAEYLAEGDDGSWHRVERGVPHRHQRIRSLP